MEDLFDMIYDEEVKTKKREKKFYQDFRASSEWINEAMRIKDKKSIIAHYLKIEEESVKVTKRLNKSNKGQHADVPFFLIGEESDSIKVLRTKILMIHILAVRRLNITSEMVEKKFKYKLSKFNHLYKRFFDLELLYSYGIDLKPMIRGSKIYGYKATINGERFKRFYNEKKLKITAKDNAPTFGL